jgi:hypothetical protein
MTKPATFYHPPPVRRRSTLTPASSIASPEFQLDHASVLAIEYARAWLKQAGNADVLATGVTRRALTMYVKHLGTLAGADQCVKRGEFQAVSRCMAVAETHPEDIAAATGRLESAAGGRGELPKFDVVLLGADEVTRRAAAFAQGEAEVARLIDAMESAPGYQLRAGRARANLRREATAAAAAQATSPQPPTEGTTS